VNGHPEPSAFLPSRSGLHFANDFPRGPVLRAGLGPVRIPIGNAANGLCGGMIFAARDLFEAGEAAPPDRTPPPGGSRLFRYLVRRLFTSFDLPAGPVRYWVWMARSTGDGLLRRGLIHRTVEREWPKVKGDLDRGVLSPLGVIRTRSVNPLQLGLNHQLLAYAYALDTASGSVRIAVYDPNHPDNDGLTLTLRLAGPRRSIEYLPGETPVRGFFRARYRSPSPRSARLLA
jgi:hypothetical protein